LLLAEITHRTPVVHWGNNSRFGDRSGRDAFRNYFEPVSDISLSDLMRLDGATFFPKKWTRANLRNENFAKWEGTGSRLGAVEFLNRPETIAVMDFYINVVNTAPWLPSNHSMHGKPVNEIYSYLAAKYLHPRSSVLSRCDSFYRTYLAGSPFVAVHLRGSDKTVEDKNLAASNRKIRDAAASVPAGWKVFLLTDDERLLSEMRGLHGDRLVTTDCQRSSTETGAHCLSSTDPVEAGFEMMTDSYLALRADKFIGNGRSNVAAMISVLRDWAPADCMLLGEAQIARPNLAVYRVRKGGGA
jgi:protein O-GlcNAc transferase